MKVIVNNKKAYFNYEILDKAEAGIELFGWEVRSIKNGKIDISGSFVKEYKNQLYLSSARIYAIPGGFNNVGSEDESRDRRLLMHKNEILRMTSKVKQSGVTIIPLEIYINQGNLIKVSIGLGKGKKKFDKRHAIKERDLKRRVEEDRKRLS